MTSDNIRVQSEAQRQSRRAGEKPHIFIGTATCGRAAGAMAVIKAIREELAKHKIDALVTEVGCIGLCYAEPLVDIARPDRPAITYRNVTPEMVPGLIENYFIKDTPRADLALGTFSDKPVDGTPCLFDLPVLKSQVRITLRNCGHIKPDSIRDYIAAGGYEGFKKALLEMTPQQVIDELKHSGLRGRGGAGFPTGLKWQFCHDAEGDQKYVICNADEGDPGAFMDRSIMEGDPHSVIEGMAIGAYAMGTTKGYIYIRTEYPLAVDRVRRALKQAEGEGFLGENILGSGFNFFVSIKEGAGAFVCGEETAMIASIEGKRGLPRTRPPFPAQSGLWGRPTNINNVKTLATVPIIVARGGDWYSHIGTEKSKGTAIFALTGKISHMGLVEVPMGTPLRDIIYDIGGGIPKGKEIKAVQTGGPTQRESCGKCVPCRLGTKQMLGILENICEGKGQPGDMELLLDTAKSVKAASLCALGGTAPNPVLTTIRYFREEYEEHIKEHRCRAATCKELITYTIIDEKCPGCGLCVKPCPVEAITFMGKKKPVILDQEKCTKCGACLDACRLGAIEVR
jgi:NADH:ubiquinone oxidoreductase subunit F (NADH-binding)/(2Fe-2S) ferredoxin/ferredoxin